jgi:hypothetical protein
MTAMELTSWDGTKVQMRPDEIESVFVSEQYEVRPHGLVAMQGEPLRMVCVRAKSPTMGNFTIREPFEQLEALLLAAQGAAN